MKTFCWKAARNGPTPLKLILILFLLGTFIFCGRSACGVGANALNYWVAPAAAGMGDGSSSANAASYLNWTFWTGLQSQLNTSDVWVNFLNGAYNGGSLNFTNMGNPIHQLTLAAVSTYGPVFSPSANIVQLYGCQNFQLNGLVFNGPTPYWGVYCIPNGFNPCRNICINTCQFLNLTNAYYAAIGLLNGARDIQVLNCTFTNITNGGHAHMIYAPHDIVDVAVSNCVFQDCLADYVRFRDDSEYCVVENSTFISTTSATGWPFVSAELYNETNADAAGDEFFGTYFQVSSNSFIYKASGGSGPYSGLHFSDTGWSPYTYDCNLTPSQESQLSSGSTSFQQSFLQTNMGITSSDIKMFGNTYSGANYHMDYQYVWDGTSSNYTWQGTIGLNNVADSSGTPMAPVPPLRNGDFDRQGFLATPLTSTVGAKDYQCYFRDWMCSPKYTDILWQQGFDGTANALRFDAAKSQYVYQWISSPSPNWTMDFLFAIGSGFSGTGVKFAAEVYHNEITGSKVAVGVNNLGQFGIYNGGTFTVLPELGTVSFSVNSGASTNYTDFGDTLNVYHMRLVGNYSAPTPQVDIYTSDANSLVLDHQSLSQTSWVGSSPVSGQSFPGTVAFYNYTAPVMVDQVSMTEGIPPITVPLVSGAMMQGNNLIMTGTNGTAGALFYVISSKSLSMPLGNWTRLSTNTFTGSSFSVTNVVASPGPLQRFYTLEVQ
ncbi:MAG TPA: hypothetical protein VGY56_10070 [Verrucomicrobiae bacterium]|nr:hypothetical protein [Verrucomicrobiae bacterium]